MLRGLAHVSALLALGVLGLAVGRWLRDPDLGAPLLGLSLMGLVVAGALRWLYGPNGIAGLHPVVTVPEPEARAPASEPAPAPLWADDPRIDVNAAGVEDLVTLPGVGPVSAARIVEEREANGPFASVQDIARVPGFGPAKVRVLADLVRVG